MARWTVFKYFFIIFNICINFVPPMATSLKMARTASAVLGGKNILVYVGLTTLSHRMAIWPLMTRLADEGHNVTFMSSHYPPKLLSDPRIHELVPPSLTKFHKKLFPAADLLKIRLKGASHSRNAIWNEFPHLTIKSVQVMVQQPDFRRWYETANFDLVIMDALYGDLGLALAYKFKARTAVIVTSSPYAWSMDAMGGSVESWIPDVQFAFLDHMTFFQRVVNVLRPIYWTLFRHWWYFPQLEKIVRENLQGLNEMPGLAKLEKNVSLVLANTHYGLEYARSSPPNFIPVGGLHCGHYEEQGDLGELGKFMDKGPFVYLSFGSAAAVSKMPEKYRQILFDSMEKSETNFVLKWEDEVTVDPQSKQQNFFLSKWLPQQNVLGHKNIKGFITHGGLLGIQEAVCASVPLIVLPMVADQDFNANGIQSRGIGLKLDWAELSEEVLTEAISKILNDSRYKEAMGRTSKLFWDRPNTPLETATWWVNYVLRHGHVEALQPLGIHQTWYERRVLDVWSFIIMVMVTVLATLVMVLVKLANYCCRINSYHLSSRPSIQQNESTTMDKIDMNNNVEKTKFE